jgi:hypothetical protein
MLFAMQEMNEKTETKQKRREKSSWEGLIS